VVRARRAIAAAIILAAWLAGFALLDRDLRVEP
jgi:hypothetical protein